MGYVLVLIASVCFAGEFALVKVYQSSTQQKMSTVFFMLFVRYAVGALVALCCSSFALDFANISWTIVLVMAGVLIAYNMLGVAILSRGNLAVYSMFMMVGGMLLPMLHGVLFMKESLSGFQIVGSVLLVAFIALQTLQFEKQDKTEKHNSKAVMLFTLLCVLAFVDNGSLGIIRTHAVTVEGSHEYTFAFLYCLLTAVIGGAGVLTFLAKDKAQTVELLKPCVKPVTLLVLIGVGCIANVGDILLLVSAGKIAESVMYPVVSGATIVFSAVAAVLIFKEKMKTREIIAVIGAALATVLFIF